MEINIKWYSIIDLPEALTLRETRSKLIHKTTAGGSQSINTPQWIWVNNNFRYHEGALANTRIKVITDTSINIRKYERNDNTFVWNNLSNKRAEGTVRCNTEKMT